MKPDLLMRFVIMLLLVMMAGCKPPDTGGESTAATPAVPAAANVGTSSPMTSTSTPVEKPKPTAVTGMTPVPTKATWAAAPIPFGVNVPEMPVLPGRGEAKISVRLNVRQRVIVSRPTPLKADGGRVVRTAGPGEIYFLYADPSADAAPADGMRLVGAATGPTGYLPVTDTVDFRSPQGVWLNPDVDHFAYGTFDDAKAARADKGVTPALKLERGRTAFIAADPLIEARREADGTWYYRLAVLSSGGPSASDRVAADALVTEMRQIRLAVLVDTTRSMTYVAATVRRVLADTVRALQRSGIHLMVAVAAFKDYGMHEPAFTRVLDFTADPAAITAAIGGMTVSTDSSNGWREAVQAGVMKTQTDLTWGDDHGVKLIWLVGDNGGRVTGTTDDPTNDQVIAALKGDSRVCTTFVQGGCDDPAETRAAEMQFADLARRTGGLSMKLADAQTLADQIASIVSDTDRKNAASITAAAKDSGVAKDAGADTPSAGGRWVPVARLTAEQRALLRKATLAADAGDGKVHQFVWVAVPPAGPGASPASRVVELTSIGTLKNLLQELQQARATLGSMTNTGEFVGGSAREFSGVLRILESDQVGLPIASGLVRGACDSISDPAAWVSYIDALLERLRGQLAAARRANFEVAGIRSVWIDAENLWAADELPGTARAMAVRP